MMKLTVTPYNVKSISKLSESGADTFLLGNEKYANRIVNSFSNIEIEEASKLISSFDKELLITMNLVMHNADIESVNDYLDFLKTIKIDGIVFGDLGLYNLAKNKEMEHLLIYHPETLNTNYYDKTFWAKKGIKGIIISKEITLFDIKEIAKDSKIDIGLIGHGHLNMFHSRRPLISNFFKYNDQDYKEYVNNRNLRLIEELREEVYPVFQDEHGTHIFREKAMESYNEVQELSQSLDYFIIDAIFKDTEYLVETLNNYKEILKKNDHKFSNKISEKYKENHDSGFLYKKTVYDKY